MDIPQHVGIIMDGNGRWAKARGLAKSFGHRAGGQALKKLLPHADKLGIKYLTVYAFSTENWRRPQDEVKFLMALLKDYLRQFIKESPKNDIKIRIIGDVSQLNEDLQKEIKHLTEITAHKTGLNLNIALNYGGRDELLRGIRKMLESGVSPENINEMTVPDFLDTKGIPDPDLIIRTAGERRLSNFLLWQAAYAEFYFCNKFWPDFTSQDLIDAVEDYSQRERRFGGRK